MEIDREEKKRMVKLTAQCQHHVNWHTCYRNRIPIEYHHIVTFQKTYELLRFNVFDNRSCLNNYGEIL